MENTEITHSYKDGTYKCKMCGLGIDKNDNFAELHLNFVHGTQIILLCISCGMKLTEASRRRELFEKAEEFSMIDLSNPNFVAAFVERKKREWQGLVHPDKQYCLVAIDKNGVLVHRVYELLNPAISKAKDFWVNKGFLAVEVFHIEADAEGNSIAVDYHGLRNY